MIIDLTPIRDRTGPSRLLDMVEGRSKQAFKTWLAARPKAWREGLEVVAMVPRKREVPPGFTGFKTVTAEELPQATAVMDPFLPRKRGYFQSSASPATRWTAAAAGTSA